MSDRREPTLSCQLAESLEYYRSISEGRGLRRLKAASCEGEGCHSLLMLQCYCYVFGMYIYDVRVEVVA